MKLFFLKHGQTPSAFEHRLSKDDEGLSRAGINEAKRAADMLKNEMGDGVLTRIISSPRKRTLETARVVASIFGINSADIAQDERLAERDCAPYLGQQIGDVFSKSEEELVAGGMEPLSSLYVRTKDFWDELLAKDSNDIVLIVGHSGNFAPLIYAAMDSKLGEAVNIPDLDCDSVLQLK